MGLASSQLQSCIMVRVSEVGMEKKREIIRYMEVHWEYEIEMDRKGEVLRKSSEVQRLHQLPALSPSSSCCQNKDTGKLTSLNSFGLMLCNGEYILLGSVDLLMYVFELTELFMYASDLTTILMPNHSIQQVEITIRSKNCSFYPGFELISVSRLAVVGGQETSPFFRGRNLNIPSTKIHCTHGY
ncbi:Squamosa promoter-binding-like protein 15 [Camellia lanceoleosa]|uniref:Squamosa promoter-binding-like protein 15 n=1 Tax=Camellia lanceoleosa TaxID=1840588 RepID=A0ACC0G248_9ERIC|nr:Squamosa promoter-binding-like protein 15 [Camellia lanceoleosa]